MSDKTPRPSGGPKSGPPDPPGPPAPPASANSSKVKVTEAKGGSSSPRPTPRTLANEAQGSEETRTLPVESASSEETAAASPAPVKKQARRAHLRLVSIDPWSVTKVTFALAVALGVVITVAISILWVVLGVSGIWDSINNTVSIVLANDADSFDITDYVGYGRVIGLTLIVSAINVILVTAIATIAAYLYNLAAQLVGGLHVTLSDEG